MIRTAAWLEAQNIYFFDRIYRIILKYDICFGLLTTGYRQQC